MRAHEASYPIASMARALGVSTSGYYAWRDREPSDRELEDGKLLDLIVKYHERSDGTYGAPRIHQDLVQEEDLTISKKRVARLMRAAGIRGVSRRRGITTTIRSKSQAALDLVERDFSAGNPDELWVADITFVPTLVGFFFLAVVIDVWSRCVVGWAMADHMRTELVLSALDMAIARRNPIGVIHYSDQSPSSLPK